MPSFEEQLAELEKIVEQLEHGDLTLEQSVSLFERGVHLSNACKDAALKLPRAAFRCCSIRSTRGRFAWKSSRSRWMKARMTRTSRKRSKRKSSASGRGL